MIEFIRNWSFWNVSGLGFFLTVTPASWKKWRLMPAVELKRSVSPSVVRGCDSFLCATYSVEKSALLMFVDAIRRMPSCSAALWGCVVENALCMHPNRQPISGQARLRVELWRSLLGFTLLVAVAVESWKSKRMMTSVVRVVWLASARGRVVVGCVFEGFGVLVVVWVGLWYHGFM